MRAIKFTAHHEADYAVIAQAPTLKELVQLIAAEYVDCGWFQVIATMPDYTTRSVNSRLYSTTDTRERDPGYISEDLKHPDAIIEPEF